ncbi:Rnase E [Mycobacterium phage Quesadilla]|uniref:RNaseE n=1 Tax=Mycobacterium phage Quesadilla TaxID=2664226 RepID=A0A5Q2WFM8_9CAUD|nr:Rnase E [Mycobacterium phage Quesadilla]QGH75317.1 RNaseE [Mycobacterium phage Quesadilla]
MTAAMAEEPDDIDAQMREMMISELMERRAKVMFLRNAGATWAAIAKECRVSEATARKDYQVVCRDLNNEQPANVVARHRAVIYDIQRANYPAMMKGNVKAATVILRALDRESRLLGLDAPTRILAGVSDIEFANEAARLIERIQTLDPDTLKELERGHTIIDAEAQFERAEADQGPDDAAGAAGQEQGQPAPGQGPGPGDAGAGDHDGQATDAPGDPSGLPGQASDPEPDDPDDDWANI